MVEEVTPAPAPETPPSGTPATPAPETPPVVSGLDPATGKPAPAPTGEVKPGDVQPFYQDLPEDWRSQLVDGLGIEDDTGKAKALKGFERFKDLNAVISAGLEAQKKIRSGETKTGLPENATEEQLQKYRESNGIPESADGYELSLEEGLVLSNEQEEILKGVYDVAHGENISTKAVNGMVTAMLKGQEGELQKRVAQDGLNDQSSTSLLRKEWGNDFEANRNAFASFFNRVPETVRDTLKSARLSDGTALVHSPELANYFVEIERKLYPAASVVPNSANPVQTIDAEIAELSAKMGTPEWFKDEPAQKRYMELLTAKNQLNKNAA